MRKKIFLLLSFLFWFFAFWSQLSFAIDPPQFKRGVNLSRVFGFPIRGKTPDQDYVWPPFSGPLSSMSDSELAQLRRLGLDFVRLPVDPGPFLYFEGEQRQRLFQDLATFITRLQRQRLQVMVDIHPATYSSKWRPADILASTDSDKFKEYSNFLIDVVKLLNRYPKDKVALELMNEPQPTCHRKDGEDWVDIQKALLSVSAQ